MTDALINFDWLEVIVGAALFTIGYQWARFRIRRSQRREVEVVETQGPVCSCNHALAFHDRETDACHGKIRHNAYNKYGEWTGYTYDPCTCRRYVGPEPIGDIWVPPILPPKDE